MSLFQCEHCGCCENTALSWQGFRWPADFDWSGLEDRRGKRLCSACGPSKSVEGSDMETGKWHGEFPRVYLPMGMFRTARNGNLEHVETGDEDFRKYELKPLPATPAQAGEGASTGAPKP